MATFDQMIAAYKAGYTHDEIVDHHVANGMDAPAAPSLQSIWSGQAGDWLAAGGGPPTNILTQSSLSGPTISSEDDSGAPMQAPGGGLNPGDSAHIPVTTNDTGTAEGQPAPGNSIWGGNANVAPWESSVQPLINNGNNVPQDLSPAAGFTQPTGTDI